MSDVVICCMGPTASGKTALAIELCQHYPVEIISVDSAMIYRDMNIGTAKPTKEELQQAPHHLIDIIDPTEAYSAAQFCDDANRLIAEILGRGKIPLLVGGTMMYFNALQNGLSQLPEADEALRQELSQQDLPELYCRLQAVDPKTAARLNENDTQRISRALEVFLLSGKPMSEHLAAKKQAASWNFKNIILFPEDRAWLHERIATRFDMMLQQGFIEEVAHLLATWPLHPQLPAMRCVGYRQALDYLNGVYDQQTLREKGIAATRQLAKRQLTWLRHWSDGRYFDPEQKDVIHAIIEECAGN